MLHEIAPRRACSVAEIVLGDHRPDVWIFDRYGGQQELGGRRHHVCLVHVLRQVPATNNVFEREIRPSVVFRKVTGGFRSNWGAAIHAGYHSVTGTAHLAGHSALGAVRDLVNGSFAIA